MTAKAILIAIALILCAALYVTITQSKTSLKTEPEQAKFWHEKRKVYQPICYFEEELVIWQIKHITRKDLRRKAK